MNAQILPQAPQGRRFVFSPDTIHALLLVHGIFCNGCKTPIPRNGYGEFRRSCPSCGGHRACAPVLDDEGELTGRWKFLGELEDDE